MVDRGSENNMEVDVAAENNMVDSGVDSEPSPSSPDSDIR